MDYQVVLHAGHELPHVAHDDVWRRFLALLGALDEIFDVLGEGGGAIGGQLKRVSSNRRAGAPVAAIRVLPVPQHLQPWRR